MNTPRIFRRWHEIKVGPLCLRAYVYRPSEGHRPFVTHHWRYRSADGIRCVPTFTRWLRAPRPERKARR